ncbi:MAG: hypothetical protein WBV70_01670, partial [Candidatus Bathyarchaeia archaeon]
MSSRIMLKLKGDMRIVELAKSDAYPSKLRSKYSTSEYYDLSVTREFGRWRIELTLKPLEKTIEKNYQGKLFEDQVEEPRVF